MKQFIIKVNLLIALFIFTILGLFFIENNILKQKASFKIPKDIKYVIMGHSHPECAFNDSLIDNFKNLARSGESYFYGFHKSENIITQNNNIEVVFIEFTNNQITKRMNDWIWSDEYLSKYPLYSPFMTHEDNYILLTNNLKGFLNTISVSIKENFKIFIKRDFNYIPKIGGYKYIVFSKTDSLLKNVQTHKIINNDISTIHLLYLKKMIAHCEANNKQVFFVRSPQHSQLKDHTNEKLYQQILHTQFSTIELLDFDKFPLTNEEYGDLGHLNYKGAKKFSIFFNHLLNNGLLIQSNKQEFINKEMLGQ